MRIQSTKPIISGFQKSDRSCNTERSVIIPGFGQACAKSTARLWLEIVLRHSGTKTALEIVSTGKKRQPEPMPAFGGNANAAALVSSERTPEPDALLAAILSLVPAGTGHNRSKAGHRFRTSKLLSELG